MTDLPIFLINLEGSDARLSTASTALHAQGATFERHPAFDGRGRDINTLPHYDAAKTRRIMGRALNGGEIGCFISHVDAAKRFLETNAPFGLVLEDDMHPTAGALALTRALVSQSDTTKWHVTHLAAPRIKISTAQATISAGSHSAVLHRAHYFPMRTTALLWSRAGAESFVASAYPITCPVDIHLRRWVALEDSGRALIPAPFTTTQAQSEIAADQPGKRGGATRTTLYPLKRASRMLSDKHRARTLKRRASRNASE